MLHLIGKLASHPTLSNCFVLFFLSSVLFVYLFLFHILFAKVNISRFAWGPKSINSPICTESRPNLCAANFSFTHFSIWPNNKRKYRFERTPHFWAMGSVIIYYYVYFICIFLSFVIIVFTEHNFRFQNAIIVGVRM